MNRHRRSAIATWIVAIILAVVGLTTSSVVAAEPWICPGCLGDPVERAEGDPLACPVCGRSYTQEELIPPIAYINSRTRDAEVAWIVQSPVDCAMYRLDGIQADAGTGTVWAPWSAVQWFIPRMRILRLNDGRELATDYPKGSHCPEAPPFVFEVADTMAYPNRAPEAFISTVDETMAELFVVAFTEAGRDSGRARFVEEVESGRHPRLPRTQPKLRKPADVRTPADKAGFQGEAVFEVRVHERRGPIRVRMLAGTGDAALDRVALDAVRFSQYGTAGEMGVAVPSWLQVRVVFGGEGSATLVPEPAEDGLWRE